MTVDEQLAAERAANQELNRLLAERDVTIAAMRRDWSRATERFLRKLQRLRDIIEEDEG